MLFKSLFSVFVVNVIVGSNPAGFIFVGRSVDVLYYKDKANREHQSQKLTIGSIVHAKSLARSPRKTQS